MDFLSSGSWWFLVILDFISCFITQLGVAGRGKSPSNLMIWGFSLAIGTIIAAFIFTGWQGGLGVFVLALIFSIVILTYAWTASGQPNMQKFIGITNS